MNTISTGQRYERAARDYLCAQGLIELASNYRSPFGEIDLIMLDDSTTVFVEVRYRRALTHGTAAESITPLKQRKIMRTALHYLQRCKSITTSCRFDVVAIGEANTQLSWYRDAFNADGLN